MSKVNNSWFGTTVNPAYPTYQTAGMLSPVSAPPTQPPPPVTPPPPQVPSSPPIINNPQTNPQIGGNNNTNTNTQQNNNSLVSPPMLESPRDQLVRAIMRQTIEE